MPELAGQPQTKMNNIKQEFLDYENKATAGVKMNKEDDGPNSN